MLYFDILLKKCENMHKSMFNKRKRWTKPEISVMEEIVWKYRDSFCKSKKKRRKRGIFNEVSMKMKLTVLINLLCNANHIFKKREAITKT